MSAPSNTLKVVVAALAGNLLIAVSKFVAAFISGSAGTLAEAVHSVADTGNQGLLLLGMKLGEKAPTEDHPFGRAAEKYFWPFIVAILLFSVGGAFAIYEGVHKLREVMHGGAVEEGNKLWSYLVLGTSFVFESYSFTVAFGEFKKQKGDMSTLKTMVLAKDPTIPVVLMEDSAALVGLFLALVGLGLSDLTGWSGWDGVASLLIGVLLCCVAYFLARETHSLLVGESAAPAERQKARELTQQVQGVRAVRQLLSMHRGPDEVLLAMKVQFEAAMPVEKVEETINAIEERIRGELPHMRYIFIEPDSTYEPPKDPRAVPS
jgi:cation diffusion facilitator family transporter